MSKFWIVVGYISLFLASLATSSVAIAITWSLVYPCNVGCLFGEAFSFAMVYLVGSLVWIFTFFVSVRKGQRLFQKPRERWKRFLFIFGLPVLATVLSTAFTSIVTDYGYFFKKVQQKNLGVQG